MIGAGNMPQYNDKYNPAPKELQSPFREWKYDGTMPYRLVEWFRSEIEKCIEDVHTDSGKRFHFSHRPPSFARFADTIQVHPNTLKGWKKEFAEFREAYEYCKELRSAIIVDGALMGVFDPAMAKFELMNRHGYQDKVTVDGTHKVVGGLSFSFIKPGQLPIQVIQPALENKNDLSPVSQIQAEREQVCVEAKGKGICDCEVSEVQEH